MDPCIMHNLTYVIKTMAQNICVRYTRLMKMAGAEVVVMFAVVGSDLDLDLYCYTMIILTIL